MTKRDELPALSEDRKRAVEHGLTVYQRTHDTLERTQEELLQARTRIAELEAEVSSLKSAREMLEAQAIKHQTDRDEAVSHRGKYEALFTIINTSLKEFQVPTNPLGLRTGSKSLSDLATIATVISEPPRMPGVGKNGP